MRVDQESFAALRTPAGAAVLAEVATYDLDGPALLPALSALRRRHPEALVSAAAGQVRLRRRAAAKFGADAHLMFFTADGVEQATRAPVATLRARRFVDAGRVLDLCCGIGGDLVALARAGLAVTGVDVDPLTADVARANASALDLADRVTVRCADATAEPLAGWPAAFCDPARRSGGRRVFDPAGYVPPYDFLARLAAAVPLTAAKVAPGIPHELLPPGVEAEWISDGGEVKEAALWFGPLATATRRATVLPAGATLVAEDAESPVGPLGRFLYEPDGAVIRAHLVSEAAAGFGGRRIDPMIAYLTADALVPTPFARPYEITDAFGFSLKRLRALLRDRSVGQVTVKKRGSAVDPALLRRQLRLSGSAHATVVLTRVAGAPTVILCEPVRPPLR